MLPHLRIQPVPSIRALSRALGRDDKRVHADVRALVTAGLIDQEQGILRTDFDDIQTSIKIRKSAA